MHCILIIEVGERGRGGGRNATLLVEETGVRTESHLPVSHVTD